MITQRLAYNWAGLPEDVEEGQMLRFVFIGESLDEWDWETKADHVATMVKLPYFLDAPVVEPRDGQ